VRRCGLLHIHNVFFFQAEDGIRDRNVTGVQTCALPICAHPGWKLSRQQLSNHKGCSPTTMTVGEQPFVVQLMSHSSLASKRSCAAMMLSSSDSMILVSSCSGRATLMPS